MPGKCLILSSSSAEQWPKQGKETTSEPQSAKSILFSWLNSKKIFNSPASLRNGGIPSSDFTLLMTRNVLPAGMKTPGGCGMLPPWVYWVPFVCWGKKLQSENQTYLCRMLEIGKLKTSGESCWVKSLDCCSQLQLKDCENHPKLNRTAISEAVFLQEGGVLGKNLSWHKPDQWGEKR